MQPSVQPYDLAFASLPEPTLLVDADGCLTGLNLAAEALLGPGAAEAAARSAPLSRALPWLSAAADRVLCGAAEAGLEAEVPAAGGRRHVAARLRPLSRGGAVRGAVAVLEDLTDRRAAEARLRAAERIAALGTLAAGIAHEVNNPLACVVAGLSFVEAEHQRVGAALPPDLLEAKAALEEAHAAALRVGRIVRSLQSFGDPSMPLLRDLPLGPVIRAAARLAEPELQHRGRLTVDLLPGVTVRGSEALLIELFAALLTDAAQALPEGTPALHAVHVTLDRSGDVARAVVSHTGGGRTPGRREDDRLAEPFFTAEGGRRPGLGLSVCLGIATALGGRLSLGGTAGGGATAVVTLPLAESTAGLDLAPPDVAQSGP